MTTQCKKLQVLTVRNSLVDDSWAGAVLPPHDRPRRFTNKLQKLLSESLDVVDESPLHEGLPALDRRRDAFQVVCGWGGGGGLYRIEGVRREERIGTPPHD